MTNVNILNCDKWAIDNQIPEIKNGNIFNTRSSEPDPEGLLSYEIFGPPGSVERKRSWGYIDLVNKFIHPHVLYELTRLQSTVYKNIVNGNEDFFVNPVDGKLTMVTPKTPLPNGADHGTGIRFLYRVWDKLNFDYKNVTSSSAANRLKMMKSFKKEEIFFSHLPVVPAFYRDMASTNERVSELNKMYRSILGNAAALRSSSGMLEVFGTTSSDRKIQDMLTQIYQYFLDILGGTKGFIHKNIMGKSTDYSARAVISMAKYDTNTAEDTEVNFSTSAIPLSTVCKCFAPFIKYGLRKLVEYCLKGSKYIFVLDPKTLEVTREELAVDFMDDFTDDDNLDDLIQLYDSSYEYRLEPLTVRTLNKQRVPLYYIDNRNEEVNSLGQATAEMKINPDKKIRAMTLTEALYVAAYTTCKDKCMYITRYPIEDQHNIYPTLFNIVPCIDTEKRMFGGELFPMWPKLPKNTSDAKALNYIFVDTVRVFPTFLKALGGDYDGDQISTQGVFTDEANEACKKYINSKMNMVNVSGGTMREFAEVSMMGAYNLTYRFKSGA